MYQGFKDLSKDGEGYIYFKGSHVEHFSYRPGEEAEEIEACAKLVGKCRKLEAWNFPVNVVTAGWCWSWFENWDSLTADEQRLYHLFFATHFGWSENKQGDLAFVIQDDWKSRACVIAVWSKETQQFTEQNAGYAPSQVSYHALDALGFETADMGQRENLGTVYATTAGVVGFIKRHQLGEVFFEALRNYLETRKK